MAAGFCVGCFLVAVLGVCVAPVRGFYPNEYVPFLSPNDYTQADITEVGILKAVAAFFETHPQAGIHISPGELTGIPDITSSKLFNRYYGGRCGFYVM
jgi:hypothetical protein